MYIFIRVLFRTFSLNIIYYATRLIQFNIKQFISLKCFIRLGLLLIIEFYNV